MGQAKFNSTPAPYTTGGFSTQVHPSQPLPTCWVTESERRAAGRAMPRSGLSCRICSKVCACQPAVTRAHDESASAPPAAAPRLHSKPDSINGGVPGSDGRTSPAAAAETCYKSTQIIGREGGFKGPPIGIDILSPRNTHTHTHICEPPFPKREERSVKSIAGYLWKRLQDLKGTPRRPSAKALCRALLITSTTTRLAEPFKGGLLGKEPWC